MKKLSLISLFSGAGGLDYGFEAAGFQTRACVEFDRLCVETLLANRKWPVLSNDISSVATPDLLAAARLEAGSVDALVGGPPCQPFSKAGFWHSGTSLRLNDPRATTIDHYLRVLEETRPRVFLLENVEGLGFQGKDEGVRRVTEALSAINTRQGTSYRASIAVLNAADFGVPQLRRRLFIVGARDGTKFHFPRPSHVDPDMLAVDLRPRWMTSWDAMFDLSEPNSPELAVQGKWADLLPSIPEGQNYLWHTNRENGEPLFGWRRRFWSFLLKLAKDRPAWTLAAQPGPATGPFHWRNRRLSTKEMMRLQTFPSDLSISGGIADAQRQLGNAVPSLLAEVLAGEIAVQLLGRKQRPLSLSLGRAPTGPPSPEPVEAVPQKYLALRGDHEAHPGTGKGFGALRRADASPTA